jgi:hypothetical protein
MKLVRLIKTCLSETYSRVRVGKHFSDMLPIKNGCFSTLAYAIRRVQVNQNGRKLNGTHQLLVYADDVNIMGGNIDSIEKNTEALVVASKETGLEVNADQLCTQSCLGISCRTKSCKEL